MMNDSERFISVVDVGEPKKLSHAETMKFRIHNFSTLQHQRGENLEIPNILAHGSHWKLLVYPRGCPKSTQSTTYVSIFLSKIARDVEQVAEFELHVGSIERSEKHTFTATPQSRGWPEFITRDALLEDIKEGTLVVTVKLRVMADIKSVWKLPKTIFPPFVTQLKNLAELSDFTFVVDGAVFRGHRSIVALRAPSLFALSESKSDQLELPGITKDAFKDIFNYLYTGELTKEYDDMDSVLDLLKQADRFACTSLKLELEAKLVEDILAESNCVRLLLFADAHACALLYEASVDMVCKQGMKACWQLIEASSEVASKVAREVMSREQQAEDNGGEDSLENLDVSSLRMSLHAKSEDVDGTRETLVHRLARAKRRSSDSS